MSGPLLYMPTSKNEKKANDASSGRHAFLITFPEVGTDLSWGNSVSESTSW